MPVIAIFQLFIALPLKCHYIINESTRVLTQPPLLSKMTAPSHLDDLYGVARPPMRIDAWEVDQKPMSHSLLDETVAETLKQLEVLVQSRLLKPAAQSKNFIWAMAESGQIFIAVEEIAAAAYEQMPPGFGGYPRRKGLEHPVEKKKLGHPTLLGGSPARIAGELAFDKDQERLVWVLNANSGRYCASAPPTTAQIDNVARHFVDMGLTVRVDHLDSA